MDLKLYAVPAHPDLTGPTDPVYLVTDVKESGGQMVWARLDYDRTLGAWRLESLSAGFTGPAPGHFSSREVAIAWLETKVADAEERQPKVN